VFSLDRSIVLRWNPVVILIHNPGMARYKSPLRSLSIPIVKNCHFSRFIAALFPWQAKKPSHLPLHLIEFMLYNPMCSKSKR